MIKTTLQKLGITCNYVGYKQIVLAIRLALEDEDLLCRITQQIYWVVAEQTSFPRCNIERHFRILVCHIHKMHPSP